MAYQRFLNDKDYLALITQEGLDQLIREVHDRIPQAERAAEVSVLEYLSQYYEVENELMKGKAIRAYTQMINYPPGVYLLLKDNTIVRTLTAINGWRKPATKVYWRQIIDMPTQEELDKISNYSQLKTYATGDSVRYGLELWECLVPNGYDFKNIRIPGVTAWKEVETTAWEPAIDFDLYQVVSYDGKFYSLISKDDSYNSLTNPADNDAWGLIGDYSTDYEYDYSDGSHDYVVYDGKVFVPVMNPNADVLAESVNYVVDDPRNSSLVKHMTQIALYQLHVLISPTNISQTRRLQYEDSMQWLWDASRFKITIDIPRKISKEDHLPKSPAVLADYHRSFNPWKDEWII